MEYSWLYKTKYSDRDNYERVYTERYNSPASYRYDFEINSYPAFVFAGKEIQQLVYDIQRLDKLLFIAQNQLPDIALNSYKRRCLIDEVRQTNEMEGVASTRKEITDILDSKKNINTRLIGIVNKYTLLLSNEVIPLSCCRDVRKLYDELVLAEVQNSSAENIPDGDIFRKEKVYVKDNRLGTVIHRGLYPESRIIESMSSVLAIIGNSEYNPLINIAVIHYMFGYIHPFYDGNGRISRFISSYLLSKSIEPILSYRLAYTIKKDINKYYKMFKLSNEQDNRGELSGFVIYFLELIKDALLEANQNLVDYRAQLNYYSKAIDKLKLDTLSKRILYILTQNILFDTDGLNISTIAAAIDKSVSTTRKYISMLEKSGFIGCTPARPYKYYINTKKL